jgi:haloacetate dehalogenase
MDTMNRRELLQQAASIAAGTALSGRVLRAQSASDAPAKFFPGFKPFTFQTSGATINGVIGGSGPPVLLLHGAPQTHISWRIVAPKLATTYTVVATDLRGYGDSSKPPDGENHANYSKRAMGLDQVEVMRHFGFDRFPVIGHDRGGRVGHRMALDHSDTVTKLSVLDIIPTSYIYTHVTIEFVQAYFHWFNYLRPAPGPENELKMQNDAQLARATDAAQREYLRNNTNPLTIHAMCEDYRASASVDLKIDAADIQAGKKIQCPLLTLWAATGAMGRNYDVLGIWKEEGVNVNGKGLPGNHSLQESAPKETLAEIQNFLKA